MNTNHLIDYKKVCVLQPDYSTSTVDYKNYDPPRNLSKLLPGIIVDHVFLNKLTTYKQLKELKKKSYDIYVNLCEGYLEWEVPSIDVVYFLEQLGLPFTGPTSLLYDPPKELMKYVAYLEGVSTPNFSLIDSIEKLETSCSHLRFPLFVKPSKSGDSLGVDSQSLVFNMKELSIKANSIIDEFGPLLIEEYIDGREFTVMLVNHHEKKDSEIVFEPIEYVFSEGARFKTYNLKTSSLHPGANVPVKDKVLSEKLKNSARSIFRGFGGKGYARLDFRMNKLGELFFLEINFTCSVFYENGFEGSADYILKNSGVSSSDFLHKIILEGISRHRLAQKKYQVKKDSIAGYGIYATADIGLHEIVFQGEERAQRIATKSHINSAWTVKELENFKKYAYPVSNEVFLLWDENPAEWAPQNHCCDPNTAYNGLNVVAIKPIKSGEELTLDYASFLDENMEPFSCSCGAKKCRGHISGVMKNSIDFRESINNI